MLYLVILILLIVGLFFTATFYLLNVFATFKGSPFVPTTNKQLKIILKEAGLKKGQQFIDLGCGDGRLVEQVAKEYKIKATGVDVNAFLIILARVRCKFRHIPAIFKLQNIFEVDMSKYDVVFVFLMPKMLVKLEPHFTKLKVGTLLISHGFKIPYLSQFLAKTIDVKPFPTYFYTIK